MSRPATPESYHEEFEVINRAYKIAFNNPNNSMADREKATNDYIAALAARKNPESITELRKAIFEALDEAKAQVTVFWKFNPKPFTKVEIRT